MARDFKSGKNIFRYRTVGIIIEDDHILLAANNMASYLYAIGGPVNVGESSEKAVKREVLEKTKEKYEIDRLLTVAENFFDYEFNDTIYDFHEVSFYYQMKPRGMIDYHHQTDIGGGRLETLEWVPLSKADELDIRPGALKEIIKDLPEHVDTIISDSRKQQ